MSDFIDMSRMDLIERIEEQERTILKLRRKLPLYSDLLDQGVSVRKAEPSIETLLRRRQKLNEEIERRISLDSMDSDMKHSSI